MIKVYRTKYCPDCHRSVAFLKEKKLDFEEIFLEESDAAVEIVMKINHGMQSVPIIVFEDGSVLVEPSNNELDEKLTNLNIKTT